jgi:hypothetical protein
MNSASGAAVIVLVTQPISNAICSSYGRTDLESAQTQALAVVPFSITAAAKQAPVRSSLKRCSLEAPLQCRTQIVVAHGQGRTGVKRYGNKTEEMLSRFKHGRAVLVAPDENGDSLLTSQIATHADGRDRDS